MHFWPISFGLFWLVSFYRGEDDNSSFRQFIEATIHPPTVFPESHRKHFETQDRPKRHAVSVSRYVKVTLCQVHSLSTHMHRGPTKRSRNCSVSYPVAEPQQCYAIWKKHER